MAEFPTKRIPDHKDFVSITVTTETDGLSNVVDIGGFTPLALEGSTAWTAAGVEFLVSQRSTASLLPIAFDSTGSTLTQRLSSDHIPAATPHLFPFPSVSTDGGNFEVYRGLRYLQLFSASTNSTAIIQQAAREWFVYLG